MFPAIMKLIYIIAVSSILLARGCLHLKHSRYFSVLRHKVTAKECIELQVYVHSIIQCAIACWRKGHMMEFYFQNDSQRCFLKAPCSGDSIVRAGYFSHWKSKEVECSANLVPDKSGFNVTRPVKAKNSRTVRKTTNKTKIGKGVQELEKNCFLSEKKYQTSLWWLESGRCFEAHLEKLTWPGALQKCKADGKTLVKLDTEAKGPHIGLVLDINLEGYNGKVEATSRMVIPT